MIWKMGQLQGCSSPCTDDACKSLAVTKRFSFFFLTNYFTCLNEVLKICVFLCFFGFATELKGSPVDQGSS